MTDDQEDLKAKLTFGQNSWNRKTVHCEEKIMIALL